MSTLPACLPSQPERADFRPEREDFRLERADSRPWGDIRTNESPPVFYRTSSPSGPLPCFPSLQFTIRQSRATGIADHILPLGDLFSMTRFAGIFPISGVYDLLPLLRTSVNDALGMDQWEAEANSPNRLLDRLYGKTVRIGHGRGCLILMV